MVGEKQDQKVPLECLVSPQSGGCYIGSKVETCDFTSSEGQRGYLVSIIFDPNAWNYTWPGNRYRKETKHVFSVSVLHPLHNIKSPITSHQLQVTNYSGSASDLLKIKSFDSTPFVVACMRRSSKEKKVALRRADTFECSAAVELKNDQDAFARANKLQKRDTEENGEPLSRDSFSAFYPPQNTTSTESAASIESEVEERFRPSRPLSGDGFSAFSAFLGTNSSASAVTSVESEVESDDTDNRYKDTNTATATSTRKKTYSGMSEATYESVLSTSIELMTKFKSKSDPLPVKSSPRHDDSMGLGSFEDGLMFDALAQLFLDEANEMKSASFNEMESAAFMNQDKHSMLPIETAPRTTHDSEDNELQVQAPKAVRIRVDSSPESPPQHFVRTIERIFQMSSRMSL